MRYFDVFILIGCLISFIPGLKAQSGLTATEIIRKADEKFRGEKSSQSQMTITIVRPKWHRSVTIKNWTLGNDLALTLIISPVNDKGKSFLKRKNEMWNWDPTISRLIKLPPSMLSEGWMGSDYTNDDILKESSLVNDFNHKILGEEIIENTSCFKIELIPKENAAVVWGKIILWIAKNDFIEMKGEYYDEDNYLIRNELSFDIKMMDDRKIPTRLEIIPAEEQGNKTVVLIDWIKFNQPIQDSFFSQQNMKNVK